MNENITVAVGLSGGVDSSLAARLLKEKGYKVIGLTMKIWKGAYKIQEDLKHACFGPGEEEDIAACERLCKNIGISYNVIDLSEEYEHHVIEYFRKEYLAGRTPNPCIICNRELKFGFLIDRAKGTGLEFDLFATGHYVRTSSIDGTTYLKTARDAAKDQSYFLYGLDSSRLSKIMFPLGEMTKEETRTAARAYGLEVADKPESQDFVGGGDYAPLFEYDRPEPGDIVDLKGNVLGQHRGLPFYTIGQRRGLGISIGPEPLYVIALDARQNQVIVGQGKGLFSSGLLSHSFRLQNPQTYGQSFACKVKIRQNHKPAAAVVLADSEGDARIDFEIPQRAVAPGQSAVLYSEDGLVLGGGIIDAAIPDEESKSTCLADNA
ncbi:tRNA-specific 2-thiouridylase MnmA [uncultured spirochete]|jgi:tRNA-specific 2-thiouridylase|uniref:tRNA-specific 2-thiouridylase MnmA n=1 Tax=uncultured spirochete TaxID=156406 RepID=A0A3P3XU76_9SPIR|nr:tRNA-specific 2-thiouridylase MnmA [uncultured spirochete]